MQQRGHGVAPIDCVRTHIRRRLDVVVNVRAHTLFLYAVAMADDDERITAWAAVLRVHAAVVPRLERELAAVGMPLSWYDVLLELNSAPDRRLRMTELGARAVLSRERVSRVVDELERAGLVRRERNPDDGRSLLAVVTEEGRARLRAAAPTYLAGIARYFGDHLDVEEARVVGTALHRVAEAQEPTTAPRRRSNPALSP